MHVFRTPARLLSLLRVTLAGLLAVAFAAALSACSGEDGPAGEDGIAPDNIPPTIALLAPTSGDTARDTLRVVANAVDNIAVDRVVFYLDGSDLIDDTTFAEDTTAPYEWEFDLLDMGVRDGPHLVMARAYDVDRNQSDTPPVVVHTVREVPTGPAVLRSWEPDTTGFLVLPERDFPGADTVSADTLHNVRFTPERRATIDSVRFYLSSDVTEDVLYDSPLHVGVFRSDGVYPTGSALAHSLVTIVEPDTVDTTLVDDEEVYTIEYPPFDGPRWFSAVDGLDEAPVFEANERFHIAIWFDEPTNRSQAALGVSYVDRYDYPTQNRSGRYSLLGTPVWQTQQAQAPGQPLVQEFMIEVWVNYE